MAADRSPWLVFPRWMRQFPADLGGVLVVLVLTWVCVFVPGVRATPLRAVVGSLFVLVVPGYVLTAVFFPESDDAQPTGPDVSSEGSFLPRLGGGFDHAERLTFAVALSVVTVPLFGLVLNFSPWAISGTNLLLSMSVAVLIGVGLAAVRRFDLPREERFRVPYDRWTDGLRSGDWTPETTLGAVVLVVAVLSVVVATGSVTYAVAGPDDGMAFTEFYLLGGNETGDRVADDYPTEFRQGEEQSLVVGVANHEHRPVDYTVVVQLRRYPAGNNSTDPVEVRRLTTLEMSVDDNETVHRRHALSPSTSGDRLQVRYLLYKGDPPADPAPANAYRQLGFWVNATG